MRGEFLSVFGAQNQSLRLIIIYYIKLHIWDLNNFARFTSEPKNKSKGSIVMPKNFIFGLKCYETFICGDFL